MNSWNGVSREWVKYPLYFVGFILMIIVIGALSASNNASKRDRCEAKGGQFIQNDYDSTLSSCVLPRRWN